MRALIRVFVYMTTKDITIGVALIILMAGSLFYLYLRGDSETTPDITGLDQQLPTETSDPLDRLTTPDDTMDLTDFGIMQYTEPPEMQIDINKNYKAVVQTNKGSITLDLFEKDAPVTVNNFVFLAREGFYNGTVFHRVISGFMIQGGDPTGTGTGGPGYRFDDEINNIKLVNGSLAMANAGPNTNGSQFFIVTAESTPWLDGQHTNFGAVTEGINVVLNIENSPTIENDAPLEPIIIESITIVEE